MALTQLGYPDSTYDDAVIKLPTGAAWPPAVTCLHCHARPAAANTCSSCVLST